MLLTDPLVFFPATEFAYGGLLEEKGNRRKKIPTEVVGEEILVLHHNRVPLVCITANPERRPINNVQFRLRGQTGYLLFNLGRQVIVIRIQVAEPTPLAELKKAVPCRIAAAIGPRFKANPVAE